MITLQGVSRRFGTVEAVRQLDLAVDPGEVLALVGPSGCGKTTVLRLVAGLERPDAGSIVLDGRTVAAPGTWVPPEARSVGLVFQDYALFPHLDALANVRFGLRAGTSAERDAAAREALARCGLAGMEKRLPHELSGGQQQRVALARALAPRPSILLLDEPLSNLDASTRAAMRRELAHLVHGVGCTTILVTHDRDDAFALAQRVIAMDAGRPIQSGTPRELYLRPASPTVAALAGQYSTLPGEGRGETATTALGPVPLLAPAHGPLVLVLRPEQLAVTPDAAGPGTVLEVMWQGAAQAVTVGLADGTSLLATVPAWSEVTAGQRVCLRPVQPAWAFPAPPEG